MGRLGFVFSLDAFVAFTLSMISISLLLFTIGTPKPYYPSLQQATELSHDALRALAASSPGGQTTYLEYAISGRGSISRSEAMNKVAGGIIPSGFGYTLQVYNFSSSSWATIYDSYSDPTSGRAGKTFTKLQASSTLFSSFYDVDPIRGESPYCYASCKGYNGTNSDGSQSHAATCSVTPCETPTSGFLPGQNAVRLVRLTVYA